MNPPRPLRLMIITLGLAGVVKAGLSLASFPLASAPEEPVLVFGAAHASGSAPEAAVETEAAPAPDCETPEEMLEAIARERELLARQKEEIADRAAEIELANEKLNIETARLAELKDELESLLARVEQSQNDDVRRLVELYRNMKPSEAASIMNDLDLEVTVMVLTTMVERDAAVIMAKMNPVRAQAISRIILERSKLPGDQRLNGVRLN